MIMLWMALGGAVVASPVVWLIAGWRASSRVASCEAAVVTAQHERDKARAAAETAKRGLVAKDEKIKRLQSMVAEVQGVRDRLRSKLQEHESTADRSDRIGSGG